MEIRNATQDYASARKWRYAYTARWHYLLVARRTNDDWKVAGSRPTKVVCISVDR